MTKPEAATRATLESILEEKQRLEESNRFLRRRIQEEEDRLNGRLRLGDSRQGDRQRHRLP